MYLKRIKRGRKNPGGGGRAPIWILQVKGKEFVLSEAFG
jgi:hypothetical protein